MRKKGASHCSPTFVDSYLSNNPDKATVDPTGRFLLVPNKGQDGTSYHTISIFSINQTTGALNLVSTFDTLAGNEPNCIVAVKLQ
jgi:6-phosphogluconolactonase (cycloisomerase 2 family)